MKNDRLQAIRQHLYVHGETGIQSLADEVGASLATLRRDLLALEQQGIVSRTHGGARMARGAEVEVAFELREKQNLAEKRAIAAAAYELIEPQSAIFLDAGTTVLQLARRLRLGPIPLSVFTNGLVVAQELLNVPKLRVTVIGGQLYNENASFVGPAAEAALDRLWFDHLFLGASAIGDDRRIYSLDAVEASLNEHMLRRAERTTVLADATKFGRRATFRVADLAPPIRVITDEALAPARQASLRENGVDLHLTQPRGGHGPRLVADGQA